MKKNKNIFEKVYYEFMVNKKKVSLKKFKK